MKSRQNLFIWVIFVLLAGFIVYLNLADESGHDGHDEHGHGNVFQSGSLLPVKLSDIYAVEIGYQGNLYLIEKDTSGNWFYHAHAATDGILKSHEHAATPDENETISIALMGLENARVERRLETTEKDEYGVLKPSMICLVYGENRTTPISQFSFGDLATDNLSRYIHLVGSDQVATIADYQYTNLIDLVGSIQEINNSATQSLSELINQN